MFDTVLYIRTSGTMSETYSELLRSRMVLLTLGSGTHFPHWEPDKQRNDDHISRRILCSYMHMESIFAEAAIQKQKVNERHYSHLGSSASWREKRSHNRMLGSHRA